MNPQLFLCVLFAVWLQSALATDAAHPVGQAGIGGVEGGQTLDDTPFNIDSTDQAGTSPPPQDNLEQLLADVEKRYGETAAILRSLYKQIEQKRRKIDKIELDILAHQRAIAKERKELAGQVKAAYEMGQQEELKLLLNQQDPALSSRMMIYYSYINKARMAKIIQFEGSIKKLEQLDRDKLSETQQLERDLQQKKSQQTALNGVRQQRKTLLEDIAATSYEEQRHYLTESENKLRNLIASLPQELGIQAGAAPANTLGSAPEKAISAPNDGQKVIQDSAFADLRGDFTHFKGKLPWPVQGKLVQDFSNLQDGVLIEAKEGLEVRAVADGKVKFADWMRSYGYLVIIDHGNEYMTLYAFNQNLYRHVNDTVKAGDIIASVGQSGGRSQAGLYFGIRKNAVPIDPLVWCRHH